MQIGKICVRLVHKVKKHERPLEVHLFLKQIHNKI